MHNILYYKCPCCKWTVRIQVGGVLEEHNTEEGKPCAMSNQFPQERLSHEADVYQQGIQWLDHFNGLIDDYAITMRIEGASVTFQAGHHFGMLVNYYHMLEVARNDHPHAMFTIGKWRAEIADRIGINLPVEDQLSVDPLRKIE